MAPTIGDLIEVFKPLYQHWAVYAGNGYVIHIASNENAGSWSFSNVWDTKAIVKKQPLRDVVGSDKWQVNNQLDNKYQPRSPREILKEAESMVGRKMPYSVTQWNCEHFATDMRYGKAESRQVRQAKVNLGSFIVGAAIGFLAVAARPLTGGSQTESEPECQYQSQPYQHQYQKPYGYDYSYYYYYY